MGCKVKVVVWHRIEVKKALNPLEFSVNNYFIVCKKNMNIFRHLCAARLLTVRQAWQIFHHWDKREVWHGDFFLCVHINVLNVLYAFLCRVQYINVLDATASR